MSATSGTPRHPIIRVIKAGGIYWTLVFGSGFLLGLIRVPLLLPRLGERVAELLEAPVMLAVIFLASRHVMRRFAIGSSTRLGAAIGLFALVLLLAAELFVAVALQGRTVTEYIAGRDPISGTVYLISLLIFAILPWLHARKNGASVSHEA